MITDNFKNAVIDQVCQDYKDDLLVVNSLLKEAKSVPSIKALKILKEIIESRLRKIERKYG